MRRLTFLMHFAGLAIVVLAAGCTLQPEPLPPTAHTQRSVTDLKRISQMEFVPDGPISLNVAIARAVSFNLQRRVKEIEREIEDAELRTKSFEMLPSLDLDASRDANSQQISSSDDRIVNTASASVTWNILDLGVSYARAKQQADEVLIAREHERKAFQDIVRQVRTAYWRAMGAQRLMDQVQGLSRNIQVAMRESRAMERSGANDVAKSVAYRREIVDSVRQALTLQRELREAHAELSELLNIRAGTRFTLATPTLASTVPVLPMSLARMEQHALENRPELRIEDYNERMSGWQAREALYEMLPGPKLSLGTNYSSDQFNLTPNWISTGFQLGMNLFGLFSGNSKIDEADKRGELARRTRLATTLAVMTQTHMAYIQFRSASQQMRLASEVARADRRLAHLVASDTDFVSTDYFEAVRIATRRLQSEMEEHQAQVDLITAHSELIHAIGLDVIPAEIATTAGAGDLAALTRDVSKITARWQAASSGDDVPPETPLDVLVNAMLRGGEAAPHRRTDPGRTIEVRLDAPAPAERPTPEIAPSHIAASNLAAPHIAVLNAFETASGSARHTDHASLPGMAGLTEQDMLASPVSDTILADAAAQPQPAAAITAPKPPSTSPSSKPSATPPAAFSSHVVQLGAFSSAPKAKRLHRRLTGPQDAALHGVDVRIVERTAADGKRLHYVETASIPDRTMAVELCATLKGLGQDCIPARR